MDFDSGECEVVDSILFDVWGVPGPQGSKSFRGMRKGKPIMSESSKKVKPWRARIKLACLKAAHDFKWAKHTDGPVKVSVQFFMPFPKTPKWKRHGRPDRMPDIDKLARSTLDGLSDSGVIYGDDRQVVDLHVIEHYVDEGYEIGARINVVSMLECAKPLRK